MHPPNRRDFLRSSAASVAADKANEKHVLAVIGVHGRGKDHIRGFSSFDDVEIAYVCDPDSSVIAGALKSISPKQKREPKVEKDLRKVLEDTDVTAVAIAAPDHWHALATVWACQAGKHVYVEKPVSHNLIEGRHMVEAARRHKRVVQVGTQR